MITANRREPAQVGDGYRELKDGEKRKEGDEFTLGSIGIWMPIDANQIGLPIRALSLRHRRREGKAK